MAGLSFCIFIFYQNTLFLCRNLCISTNFQKSLSMNFLTFCRLSCIVNVRESFTEDARFYTLSTKCGRVKKAMGGGMGERQGSMRCQRTEW